MIKVADVIMGGGKSSAAIQYINDHPKERYLYITPLNSETKRVKDCCPGLRFVTPALGIEEYGFTKSGHFKKLIDDGRNIATTHSLFSLMPDSVCEQAIANGYTVFIDEAVDMYEPFVINRDDLQIVLDSEWLTRKRADGNTFTYYEENPNKQYTGSRFRDIFTYVHSKRLVVGSRDDVFGDQLYWMYHDKMFKSNLNIYVLTYMFEGSTMAAFFKMNDISYETIGVRRAPNGKYYFCDKPFMPSFAKYIRDKVHICDNDKMNHIGNRENAFSFTWSANAFRSRTTDAAKKTRDNLTNFFTNIHRDIPSNQRLWCSYKSGRKSLADNGYKTRFLAFNYRATNEYKDCRALAYCVNPHPNTNVVTYLAANGVEIDSDLYALSGMVQWVWRSAIRAGEDIYLYVPSRRMRTLFTDWLNRIADEAESAE